MNVCTCSLVTERGVGGGKRGRERGREKSRQTLVLESLERDKGEREGHGTKETYYTVKRDLLYWQGAWDEGDAWVCAKQTTFPSETSSARVQGQRLFPLCYFRVSSAEAPALFPRAAASLTPFSPQPPYHPLSLSWVHLSLPTNSPISYHAAARKAAGGCSL